MSNQLIVHKGLTNTHNLNLGIDTSADTITSQIRSEARHDAPLIMEWTVTPLTDGTDGKYVLTVDDVITSQIVVSKGFMDIRRISAGEPIPVFDTPIEVIFREYVTTDEEP